MSIHKDRVVLAYSGGLDTSVAIGWIGEATRREGVGGGVHSLPRREPTGP